MSNSIHPISRANRPKIGTVFFWVSRNPFNGESAVYEVKVTNPNVPYGVERIEVGPVHPIEGVFDFNQWVWTCDLHDTPEEAAEWAAT